MRQFYDKIVGTLVPKDKFIEVMGTLPNVIKEEVDKIDVKKMLGEIDFATNVYWNNFDENVTEIVTYLFNSYIYNNTQSAYVEDDVDIEKKEITIYDVDSFEELEKIQKDLEDWKISDYDDIKESLEEFKEEDESEEIITFIKDKIHEMSLDELKNLKEKLL